MARALIVACGCRGLALGDRLTAGGWSVRGTTRGEQGCSAIAAAGIEPAIADPQRPGTLLDLVGDVAVVHWLLGSASGEPADLDAVHGARLRAFLERLIDTPVRGFVYEAAGTAGAERLRSGAAAVGAAAESWRIRVEVVTADPAQHPRWLAEMAAATERVVG